MRVHVATLCHVLHAYLAVVAGGTGGTAYGQQQQFDSSLMDMIGNHVCVIYIISKSGVMVVVGVGGVGGLAY